MSDLMWLYTWASILSTMISFKILMQDKKLNIKTVLYLLGGSALLALCSAMLHTHTPLPVWLTLVIVDVSIKASLTIVAYEKGYTVKKSLIFPLMASTIVTIVETTTGFAIEMFNLTHITAYFVIVLVPLLSLIVVYITKKMRDKINQSEELQIVLLSGLIFFCTGSHIVVGLQHQLTEQQEFIAIGMLLLFGFLTMTIFNVWLSVKNLEEKYQIQRKQDEYESMQYYTNEIEKQYTDMRKFKHDYQNILSSLNEYIDEGDLYGLKDYFHNKVEIVSNRMMNHDFMLENLSRVKVKEVKSILAAKLMMAQEKGVVVNFEAREDINMIPIDTVALVRMLGIILDNAIEELIELGEGIMQVGVWNEGKGVTFIVQNACHVDTPKLHKLEEYGFSTKGEKRGIGINNLLELVEKAPNVLLQTSIADNQFIQKIIITGE